MILRPNHITQDGCLLTISSAAIASGFSIIGNNEPASYQQLLTAKSSPPFEAWISKGDRFDQLRGR